MKSIATLVLVAALLFAFGCKDTPTIPKENKVLTRKATDYEGQLAHDWVQLTDQMIRENHLAGLYASRIYGYVGLTFWESVRSGIPEAKSLAGQINAFGTAAAIDLSKEYDWGIVLTNAMAVVLPTLIEQITPAQRDRIEVLAIVQTAKMVANGADYDVRDDSKNLGVAIGNKILQRIKADGREAIRLVIPVSLVRDADHPWYWSPAVPGQQPLEPLWGTVQTFVVKNAQSCAVPAPYPYSVMSGSPFYQDAQEVYLSDRGNLHRSIAYHWEDGETRTSGPAGHWINITSTLLQDGEKNLAECAKTYCLAGLAIADAFVVSWNLKYKYNQMLAATYVKEQFSANWKPLVNNPPYPDYISTSAAVGGAAPLVLTAQLGEEEFIDKTQLGTALYTPDGGPFVLPERTFESLIKAGEEEAESGVLSGIHFRRACEEGLASGRCIGNTVLSQLNFGF